MTLAGNPELVQTGFDAPPDMPLDLMRRWLEGVQSVNVNEPFGFTLATTDDNGIPSTRVLLMKECDDHGIIFATSGHSPKARHWNHFLLNFGKTVLTVFTRD